MNQNVPTVTYGDLSDLALRKTVNRQDDDYPKTLFHEECRNCWKIWQRGLSGNAVAVSTWASAHMVNLLGCLFRYTFLVMDREHFRQVCRE